MLTFCVLGTLAEIDSARLNGLLDELRSQFGDGKGGGERVSYFVHREPPRAVEFICDDADREAVCTWLLSRPEITDVRVDPVQ